MKKIFYFSILFIVSCSKSQDIVNQSAKDPIYWIVALDVYNNEIESSDTLSGSSAIFKSFNIKDTLNNKVIIRFSTKNEDNVKKFIVKFTPNNQANMGLIAPKDTNYVYSFMNIKGY